MEVSTNLLIELAFAAYRVNKGYEKHTRRYSEDTPTTYSNKELVQYTVNPGQWLPDDFIPLTITEEDRAAKAAGDKHMRRYTMLALVDLNEFQNDMFTAYS